jgi:endonuclease YncB( thermonuclease family)
MPETKILTDAGYAKLLKDLRRLMEEGKSRAQAAASEELLTTYWLLGKRITEEGLTENAGYGESILEDLAEDLDMDVSSLRRAVYFFEAYQKGVPRGTHLSWSHYRELLSVSDEAARAWYEEEAENGSWTRDDLANAIKREAYEASQDKEKAKRGKRLKRPTEAVYVYKAIVERVVDGDTLLLRLDLGFQVWKEQRIRLAEVDAPSLDEPKGFEAFEFVRDQLAKAAVIVLKTNKIDIYGRYVAHLFYSTVSKSHEHVFQEGRYLNQELLDRGLARLA